MQTHADLAAHEALRAAHVRREVLVVRGEPQAVVDEVGVLLRELRLEAQRLLRQHHVLERAVRGMKDHRRGRLVDLARLDPDQAVLDLIDAADAVLPAELVEALDELDAVERRRRPG